MYGIGKTEDNPDAKRLVFLIHPKIKSCVIDFKMIEMEVKIQGKIMLQ